MRIVGVVEAESAQTGMGQLIVAIGVGKIPGPAAVLRDMLLLEHIAGFFIGVYFLVASKCSDVIWIDAVGIDEGLVAIVEISPGVLDVSLSSLFAAGGVDHLVEGVIFIFVEGIDLLTIVEQA